MSLTKRVPACVPLLTHSSRPSLPFSALNTKRSPADGGGGGTGVGAGFSPRKRRIASARSGSKRPAKSSQSTAPNTAWKAAALALEKWLPLAANPAGAQTANATEPMSAFMAFLPNAGEAPGAGAECILRYLMVFGM